MQKRSEPLDIGGSASGAGSEQIGHSAQTNIRNRAGVCIVPRGGGEGGVSEGGGDVLRGRSSIQRERGV